jgi:hypothetical protein
MNALVPYRSATPKSVSKPSVMVYHGIFQPIRAFTPSISGCGARGQDESGVAGVQVGDMGDLVGYEGAAGQA